MSYMAQWGSKGFILSPTQIVILENFSTSVELKSDSESDTSGTSHTNTRGLEARPVSCSVTYTRAAGVDPRTQLEEWESLVGKSNPLYIGGKLFGPSSLILQTVESTDFAFSPTGDFLSVTINLSFIEDTGGKTSSTTKKKKNVSYNGKSGYISPVTKAKAMNATASKSDRKTHRPMEM